MKARRVACAFVLVGLSLITAMPAAQPRPRVDPNAREILAYRLTLDAFRRFTRVTADMDTRPAPQFPGAVRADTSLFVVLAMAFAYNTPWRDNDVAHHAASIDGGQPDLAAAIRHAGLTTREYVLIQMTLLLSHPIVTRRHRGIVDAPPADVAVENVDFVAANWAEVDAYMTAVHQRIARERGRP
jgi:hypothetical protein